MSKFQYHANGSNGQGRTIYDVQHADSGKHIGLVESYAITTHHFGWTAWVRGQAEHGFRSRNAAAERLLIVAACNPAAFSALPTDPFDGIATTEA